MSNIVERIHGRMDMGWRRVTFEGAELDEVLRAFAEVERLNKWADGFSDAQLKERRLCEERIQELRADNERLRSDLQIMTDSYAEVSRVVGRRGTEEHSLADDVRKLCAENERLAAAHADKAELVLRLQAEIDRLKT